MYVFVILGIKTLKHTIFFFFTVLLFFSRLVKGVEQTKRKSNFYLDGHMMMAMEKIAIAVW